MSSRVREDWQFLDLEFAHIRLILCNTHRDRSKQPLPFKIEQMMLLHQTVEEKSKTELSEEHLAYVQNFLHPYFEAKHEWEEQQQKTGEET